MTLTIPPTTDARPTCWDELISLVGKVNAAARELRMVAYCLPDDATELKMIRRVIGDLDDAARVAHDRVHVLPVTSGGKGEAL